MSHNDYSTRRYRCHINVEQIQRGGVVAYLIEYASKPQSNTPIPRQKMLKREQCRSRYSADPNIKDHIRVIMQTRVVGAIQACCSIYNLHHTQVFCIIDSPSLQLEGDRAFLLRDLPLTCLETSVTLAWLATFRNPNLLGFCSLKYKERARLCNVISSL